MYTTLAATTDRVFKWELCSPLATTSQSYPIWWVFPWYKQNMAIHFCNCNWHRVTTCKLHECNWAKHTCITLIINITIASLASVPGPSLHLYESSTVACCANVNIMREVRTRHIIFRGSPLPHCIINLIHWQPCAIVSLTKSINTGSRQIQCHEIFCVNTLMWDLSYKGCTCHIV